MRLVYLDESGIGNPQHEPWTTVSGIIVDADSQLELVESHLISMADRYAPAKKREDFTFTAKELFSGGSAFPREDYSKEYRWAILRELASLPVVFGLPVILGFADRRTTFSDENIGTKDHTAACVAAAFLLCLIQVEHFMHKHAREDEVALLVMENNNENRQLIKETHKFVKNHRLIEPLISDEDREFLPITKIKETPLFAEKNDSSLLQIADTCAFVTKRRMMNTSESAMFYKLFSEYLVARPKSDFHDC